MKTTNIYRGRFSWPFRSSDFTRSVARGVAVIMVGLAVGTVGRADDEPQPERRGGAGPDVRKRMLEEYDTDRNGRLDDAEREALRAAMAQRQRSAPGLDRRELAKRFDKDGDGRLNDEERQAAMQSGFGGAAGQARQGSAMLRPADRAEIMKRFDKDNDGQLSEAERSAARDAFTKRQRPGSLRPGSPRPSRPGGTPPSGARPTGARPQGAGPATADRRMEFLKRFDKDGDGQLDPTERAAARAAFEARTGNAGRPGGARATDATPAEKPDTGRVNKQAMLQEFDANGDGKLTGQERSAARKAFEERRKKAAE